MSFKDELVERAREEGIALKDEMRLLDEAFQDGDLVQVAMRANVVAEASLKLSATCLQITMERTKT